MTGDKHTALVQLYDSYTLGLPGDIEFYVEEAIQADGPVLELASGTGRILLPIARAGIEITGLDLSSAMLDLTRHKLAAEPVEVQQRVTLVEGDMSDFELGRRFQLITVPFNSFLILEGPAQHRAALTCIRRHLEPGGRLVFNIFDPSIPIISAYQGLGGLVRQSRHFEHEGRTFLFSDTRTYRLAEQVAEVSFIFEELNETGAVIHKWVDFLRLRYIFRYEMQYLLELCGFQVLALYGDHHRGEFRHGAHQVWVAGPR